ncbi:MAG: TonB-dependent receptor [Steroidobacteraceae bacterium]|nr:TonB-dependent receptor [Steroidobacteraceae bacterium]
MWRSAHSGLLAGCLVGLASLAAPAQAQSDPAAVDESSGLEEVIVTARKREETLLEVPVAVTALSATDIDQRGIENLNDVALFVPGLTYFDAIQNQLGTPVIRGISQTNLNSPDRNVAIFYGGVYLSSTSGANLEILDVDRIEVVKGPQSALYGRNAFNGAINFVPAAPTDAFFSRVEATVGTDERYEGKLVVSGPLTERIRGRFAASYNTFDGTVENRADPGDKLGGWETKNASGTLDFAVTEDLNVRLFGFYTDDHRDPGYLWFFDVNNCGPNPMAFTAVCGEIPTRSNLASNPLAEGLDREVALGALDVSWKVGPLTFVSQTAQYDLAQEAFTEYTANGVGDPQQIVSLTAINALVAMGTPFAAAVGAVPTLRIQNIPQFTGNPPADTSAFSQEFRIESDQEKRLRGSVGVFYFKNEAEALTSASFDARGIAPTEFIRDALFFTAGNPALVTRDPRTLFVTQALERTDYQRAYFGTFEFDVSDQLTVGGEARHDTEDRRQFNRNVGPASLQRKEFEYNTWRYHADYSISETQKTYVSAAKGVISGFFNPTVDAATRQPLPLELQSYDAAENRTYEIGWKAEWLDRRLNTELTAFYVQYTGIQINGPPPPPAVTAIIQNLGKVNVRGVEAAMNWAITDRIRVGATWAYTPTEFGENSVEPGILRYCGGQATLNAQGLNPGFCRTTLFRGVVSPEVGGQSLPRAPESNASLYGSFSAPLSGDWSFFGRADVSYISKAYTMTWNVAEIPERTVVNARFGVRRGDNLEVALWGRNVFDEEFVTAVIFQPHFNLPAATAFVPNVSQGELATFGLTASYRFD